MKQVTKTASDSVKYWSSLLFLIGTSLWLSFFRTISDWLVEDGYLFSFDLKLLIKIVLALVGALFILFGGLIIRNEENATYAQEQKYQED